MWTYGNSPNFLKKVSDSSPLFWAPFFDWYQKGMESLSIWLLANFAKMSPPSLDLGIKNWEIHHWLHCGNKTDSILLCRFKFGVSYLLLKKYVGSTSTYVTIWQKNRGHLIYNKERRLLKRLKSLHVSDSCADYFLIATCSGMISKGSYYYTAVLDTCIDVLKLRHFVQN